MCLSGFLSSILQGITFTASSVGMEVGLIWFLVLGNGPSALGPQGDSHPEVWLTACFSPPCGEAGCQTRWCRFRSSGFSGSGRAACAPGCSLSWVLAQPLPCPLCVHPTLRALVGSEWVGRDIEQLSMPLLSSLKDLMLLPMRATSSIKPNTLVAAAKPP